VHPNELLIQSFYEAFSRCDGDFMASCYTPDATFSDPVFTDLRGAMPGAMWRMLARRAKDLKVQCSRIHADDHSGSAHWEAWYTFSATQRPVHNMIEASFTFRDGKIATHRDTFDLWRWSRQALGLPGVLLGWTPLVQRKIRADAAKGLAKFYANDAR